MQATAGSNIWATLDETEPSCREMPFLTGDAGG